MHELSLTESIVELAVEAAKKEGAKSVRRIVVEIGQLSHVDAEALLFCFEAVSVGTIAEGGTLEINRPPGQGWCMDCAKSVALAERFGPCPECGRFHVVMTAGDELRVREIEAE